MRRTKHERGAHPKGGASDRESIDDIPDTRKDVVTNERIETRADGHRKAPTMRDKPEYNGRDQVRNPSVKAPVVEGNEYRLVCLLVAVVETWLEQVAPWSTRTPCPWLPALSLLFNGRFIRKGLHAVRKGK